MSNFFEYMSAAFWHWWPLVSAGSLLGIEEFLQRYSERFKNYSTRFTSGHRRAVQVCALFAALFYSGFLAWNDEHTLLLEANKKLSEAGQQVKPHSAPRNLTAQNRSIFIANREAILGWKYPLFIYATGGDDSFDYAWQFYELMSDGIGLGSYYPQQVSCRLTERGLLVALKHQDDPSKAAREFIALLREAKLSVSLTRWYMADFPDTLDFSLFVCPTAD